jgi:hypothetical protein
MKRFIALLVALVLPVFAAAAADTSNQAVVDPAVVDAAKNWLALIDSSKYEQSWNEASKLFQEHVTKAQWAKQAKIAREPFGNVVSRSTQVVRFTTSLPGVPDGQYAVLQFHAKFAHKANAVETVTMMRQDGMWKAGGYFIK